MGLEKPKLKEQIHVHRNCRQGTGRRVNSTSPTVTRGAVYATPRRQKFGYPCGRASAGNELGRAFRRLANNHDKQVISMPDTLYHYTTTTGHGRWSPRSEVADHIVDYFHKLFGNAASEFELPAGFSLERPRETEGRWVYTILTNGGLIAKCWLLPTMESAKAAWPEVQTFSESVDSLCLSEPPQVPLLAVVPNLKCLASRDQWESVGDLERCVAWALL